MGRNFQYFGEAAPLPGFSSENLQDTRVHIERYIDDWPELFGTDHSIQQLQAHYLTEEIPPALQFSLDSLAYQLEAQEAKKSLGSFLFEDDVSKLAVNGLVSLVDNDDPLSSVQKMTARGFQTIKCKIGANFDREKEVLIQIRNRFPELHIRLDANRAWTLEEADDHLQMLESVGIEYCEEPLRHPTAEKYNRLSRQISLPLALDESVNKNQHWESLLPYCSVLIIKPMMIGSFAKLFAIRQQAQQNGCRLVFTSSLESSIGRTVTAVLASGLGSADYAHGLNTGTLLAQDIRADQPNIISGVIHPDELNPSAIDKSHLKNIATNIISSR